MHQLRRKRPTREGTWARSLMWDLSSVLPTNARFAESLARSNSIIGQSVLIQAVCVDSCGAELDTKDPKILHRDNPLNPIEYMAMFRNAVIAFFPAHQRSEDLVARRPSLLPIVCRGSMTCAYYGRANLVSVNCVKDCFIIRQDFTMFGRDNVWKRVCTAPQRP